MAAAERLEGGWNCEPRKKPGSLWVLLDIQVIIIVSASPFVFFITKLPTQNWRNPVIKLLYLLPQSTKKA
jgi:hypothetical protein